MLWQLRSSGKDQPFGRNATLDLIATGKGGWMRQSTLVLGEAYDKPPHGSLKTDCSAKSQRTSYAIGPWLHSRNFAPNSTSGLEGLSPG